jgi:hypothetical protein
MTPEEIAKIEFNESNERGLRAELSIHGYNPSPIISKEILINVLLCIYFGGENECLEEN